MKNYTYTVVNYNTKYYFDDDDKLHRLDGPAIEYTNGTKVWYKNGKLHREDGPAVEYANSDKEWWVNGTQYTEEEFNSNQHLKLTTNEIETLNNIVAKLYGQYKAMGWHDKPREFGTMIALVHSELSEALEGDRKGLMDDHLPHRKMTEVELADAVIRICDMCGKYGFDLGNAIAEKHVYNKTRKDHQKENREKSGGKAY